MVFGISQAAIVAYTNLGQNNPNVRSNLIPNATNPLHQVSTLLGIGQSHQPGSDGKFHGVNAQIVFNAFLLWRVFGVRFCLSLLLNEGLTELDVERFSQYAERELPAYARPVFLRIQTDIDVTGTFKMVKGDLREQAYNLDQVDDSLYVWKPQGGGYELLDAEYAAVIAQGEAGF